MTNSVLVTGWGMLRKELRRALQLSTKPGEICSELEMIGRTRSWPERDEHHTCVWVSAREAEKEEVRVRDIAGHSASVRAGNGLAESDRRTFFVVLNFSLLSYFALID